MPLRVSALALAVLCALPWPALGAAPVTRRLCYSFTVRNERPTPSASTELVACAPVASTAFQTVRSLVASPACTIATDALLNQSLRVAVPPLAPYGTCVVQVQVEVAMAAKPRGTRAKDFLEPEAFIESKDPAVMAQARKLAGRGSRATLERCFRFVAAEVKPTGFTAAPRGALWALTHRAGDCTEAACLLAALCRASGIPARVVEGVRASSDGAVRPGSFHDWTEVYLDGAWRVADAQGGAFMRGEEQYVAFEIWTAGRTAKPRCRVGDGLRAAMDGAAAGRERVSAVSCGCGS